MKFFCNSSVIALTSDARIDFTPANFDAPLTVPQQAYLKQETGVNIPQVFWRRQIHEADVIVAQGSSSSCSAYPDADAFVTNQKNLPIAVRTADCVPIFIYDFNKHIIGLAHAGWKGTQKEIALKTIQTMKDKFNCQCYDLQVAIGPSIRSCCYQVGPEFKAYFPQDTVERNGGLYVDIVAANRRQLRQAGVPQTHIIDSGICTMCSSDYFSFRRDGAKAGRMISLMELL